MSKNNIQFDPISQRLQGKQINRLFKLIKSLTSGSSGISTITAGNSNITVDNTDPANLQISSNYLWIPRTGFTAINVLASYNRNIFVDIGVFLSNGQVTIQPEDSGTRAYPDGMEFMVKAPSADAIDFNEGVGVTITRSGGGAITNLDKDTLWHCIYLGGNAWIIK